MCIYIDGHHSGGSSFVYVNDFCYYRNCLYTHRYKFSSEKKKTGKESQFIVSRPKPVRICHSDRTWNRGVTFIDIRLLITFNNFSSRSVSIYLLKFSYSFPQDLKRLFLSSE